MKQRYSFGNQTIMMVVGIMLLLIPQLTLAKTYNNVVAFGDSLSDHHGLSSYLGVYDPVNNPTGALEVWSNGDTWVEYLANQWGAVLDNNSIAGAMSQGHESAEVQALSDAGTLPQLGLVGQVNLYTASSPSITADDTLFTILIGGNNFLEFGRGELYTTDYNVMIADAMTHITYAVTNLYAIGARNFLIANLPDIGKTPAYNSRTPEQIAQVTQLVGVWNGALKALVTGFKAQLADASFDEFDLFTYLNRLIETNAFNNVTGTYMELDATGNYTGNVNGPAEDYLFWDNIHPTTLAHEMMAEEIVSEIYTEKDYGDSSSCFISSIQGSAYGSRTNLFFFVGFLTLISISLGLTVIRQPKSGLK